MFGLFSKKKYKFICPICDYGYSFKLNPKEVTKFDYPNSPTYTKTAKLSDFKCEFCKSHFTVLMTETGKVFAIDEKWEIYRNDYDAKLDALIEKISDIEYSTNDDDDETPLTDAQQKKIEQLQTKIDKLNESNEKKEEKYYDKQAQWQEKNNDKQIRD